MERKPGQLPGPSIKEALTVAIIVAAIIGVVVWRQHKSVSTGTGTARKDATPCILRALERTTSYIRYSDEPPGQTFVDVSQQLVQATPTAVTCYENAGYSCDAAADTCQNPGAAISTIDVKAEVAEDIHFYGYDQPPN
jgi:hypothetical protein